MFEQAIVALIVLVAVAYSAWHICPASVRLALVQRLQKRCQSSPIGPFMPAIARAAAVPNGACAGCGARARCGAARGAAVEANKIHKQS